MSVFKKLQQARVKLQSIELKKSGKNTFAKYSYFELADFLPAINTIFDEVGLCDVISFTDNSAFIQITDVETGEHIVFTSPSADAPLKGALPIQALGAQHTYLRRYLYLLALNIVEHDSIDASEPVKTEPVKSNQVKPDLIEPIDIDEARALIKSATDSQNLLDIWNKKIPKEHHKELKTLASEISVKLKEQQ